MRTGFDSDFSGLKYHDDLLIIDTPGTPTVSAMMTAVLGAGSTFEGAVAMPRGITALQRFARNGRVLEVTPVRASPATSAHARSILAAAIESVVPRRDSIPLAAADLVPGPSFVRVASVDDRDQLLRELEADPLVSATRVPIRYLLARKPKRRAQPSSVTPSNSIKPQWNLAKIRWESALESSKYKSPSAIKVAVLDTGVQEHHPDLKGLIRGYRHSYDGLQVVSSEKDVVGHGTHVAGIIAANAKNNIGISGICKCALYAWKIFDDVPRYYASVGYFAYFVEPRMYLRALLECFDQKIDVINLSIGGPAPPSPQETAIFSDLIGRGTTVVAAMGNERQYASPISYPAAIPGVIAVGATDILDRVTSFSNRGSHITISAPGDAIWSTLPTYPGQHGFKADLSGPSPVQGKRIPRENDYAAWPGTSMASPHVAAAAAVAKAKLGTKGDPAAVRDLLTKTAAKVPGMQGAATDPDYGYGRLDMHNLVDA